MLPARTPPAWAGGWSWGRLGARIRRLRWQAAQALKNVRPPADLRNVTSDALEAYYRAPRGAGFIVDVRLDQMRTFGSLGLRCTKEGDSPFVRTLLAYEQGRCRTYQDSPLRRFYEIWQPANLAETLLIDPSQAGAELLALPPIPWLVPWSGGADWDRWIGKTRTQIARRTRRLGDAYALNGDLILALESFQYAAALAPDDAAYWRALAEFCGRQGIQLDDIGVPAAQRAVTLDKDAQNLDMLGWLLYLDARYVEAERILLDALAIDSKNASVYFHLGLLYLQTGDRPAAFESLSRARDLGSADADAVLKQNFP